MSREDPEVIEMTANILEKITLRRRAVGLSQKDMLTKAGLSSKSLQHMARGTPPNTRTLLAIANALDVSIGYFFSHQKTPGALDLEVLENAIKTVEAELTRKNRVTTLKRRVAAIGSIYESVIFVKKHSDDDKKSSPLPE